MEKKLGIFAMLDEECKFPNGTDASFTEKLHKTNEKDEYYAKPRLKVSVVVLVGCPLLFGGRSLCP